MLVETSRLIEPKAIAPSPFHHPNTLAPQESPVRGLILPCGVFALLRVKSDCRGIVKGGSAIACDIAYGNKRIIDYRYLENSKPKIDKNIFVQNFSTIPVQQELDVGHTIFFIINI